MNRLVPCVALAILLAACKPDGQTSTNNAAGDGATPTSAPASTDAVAASASRTHPALQVETLDGGRFDLAAHRGQWVIVNFWATWCAPCLKEMPELSALDAMREHIQVIGLAYEDIEPDDMRAFLQKHPVVYPIAIIDTFDPPADFDTPPGLPMTYLIGPEGQVVEKILGPVTAEGLETMIAGAGGPTIEA
ncbi:MULTISPECIES: TlpA disulfide reductase family protein [Luteimonas]|uniref:Thiol-disulfide isomerase/thioredoxin n=1 Tax=Luteimonas terrae TaxID=1530191 RepID=A0ABU1XV50_9GAMM|nr:MULTISPECIES: TlpA disulfide reductase family protein [Luteimonas]MDR6991321.1 thiol-disulfide isomerase/thioredoxin [Luteimonas sp. 3794]MDR7192110.1 thiol-disulfide isomerase/thioredoxin [Luteimonas terrae]